VTTLGESDQRHEGATEVARPIVDGPAQISQTLEGEKLLAEAPRLRRWWDGVRSRESVARRRPSLG
jgi:hypothetical protein